MNSLRNTRRRIKASFSAFGLDGAIGSLRVAVRSLRARPAYALIPIATLSLVVGVGSAVLAVINATFIRPLPFAEEDRLVAVFARAPGSTSSRGGAPLQSPAFVRMRERLRTVEIAGMWPRERALMTGGGADLVEGAGVSSNYFRVLGIPLAAGRAFTDEEDKAAARVAVVSATFARSRLGGETPLGATVVLDGRGVLDTEELRAAGVRILLLGRPTRGADTGVTSAP